MESSTPQFETEIFAAERQWELEGVPVLTATVSLPQPTASDRTARRVRRYYRAQARAYLRYCDRFLLPTAAAACRAALEASRPLPQFRAELTHRVTFNSGGFWSLYTQSREAEADGSTLLRRWGDTWDLRTGYPAELRSFFPRRSGWKRLLLETAETEIRRQEAAGFARYHPGWRRGLRRFFNPLHYYLTEEGLAFFYSMYAIAPAATGIPTFVCPWSELRGTASAS